ncbi:hypothetical protein DPMN_145608 [Dreissena polymorpha]|uniref:Uncharacterized protein n=1 Tax=Dreissena polymorpha TaxID=45954 RepID=A0A9D4F722_DREPO|nr:hypothetical protein DPMN_145608 [Dreissena polymorpha]
MVIVFRAVYASQNLVRAALGASVPEEDLFGTMKAMGLNRGVFKKCAFNMFYKQ